MTESEAFGLYASCDEITDHWEEHWTYCPICGARANEDGLFIHADPKEKN